ncbi:MAG: fatty acyl-AMP ligase [Myxococcota bacterium]|nr:fatty acyl-AMP ligase [Myxococcota bacterium]
MPSLLVAPTLVDAVRRLGHDRERGFVFVRPNGTERLYTFHAIAAEAERRASHLAARGLRKGDRLALVLPEGDEFVLSFLGALFAGVVPVPIYPQLSFKNVETYHDTVAHIARASRAAMLLTSCQTRPFVEPIAARIALAHGIVAVEDLAGEARRVDVPVFAEDLAFLQFTSGSTSRPKGVMVTHANLAANSEAFMIHGLKRDERVDKGVSWLPLFHDMGLIGFVVGPLFTNVPCVFLPTASFVRAPRLWLEKIHEHRGTITYAPNFAYALVAKRLKDKDVADLDLTSLRVAGCGAEPIRARSLRDFASKLAPTGFDARAFVPSYGMAEATLAVTFMPLGEGLRVDVVDAKALTRGQALPPEPSSNGAYDGANEAPGADHAGHVYGAKGDAFGEEHSGVRSIVDCGRCFPEHELAIVDEAGERMGDRQVGQVVVRGPSISPGYFEEFELTKETFRPLPGVPFGDPWLWTGDLGYLSEGRLFVCGRVKDVIIIRGRNYYPSDIEWAVSELPGIRRGNVVAFGADFDGEEQLVVCCEGVASDVQVIEQAMSACIVAQFGLAPHEVVVAPLASLPRTSSGKPQRRKTRQMYIEGTMPRARSVHGVATTPTTGTPKHGEQRVDHGKDIKKDGVDP